MEVLNITQLQEKIRQFAAAREWERYHTPKNIAMALTVEAAELLEIFQWLSEKESFELSRDEKKIEMVADEISDIMVYMVRLADLLKIDIPKALNKKMEKNALKYPVETSRGNAKKYNELA